MFRRVFLYSKSRAVHQRRQIFIETETTPNPHSMKFLPGVEVLPQSAGTGLYFQQRDKSISTSPLAKKLLALDGVKGIFLGSNFVTVTKDSQSSWTIMKPLLFCTLFDFFAEGKPVVDLSLESVSDTSILPTDNEVVATIKELIETRVRPAVQDDGGDIFYEGFDEDTGVVKVRLAGSCVGCPSSSITLRNGVEKMLMHYIPEVKGIMEVGKEESE